MLTRSCGVRWLSVSVSSTRSPGLADKEAILGGNLIKLLRLPT